MKEYAHKNFIFEFKYALSIEKFKPNNKNKNSRKKV